MITHDTTTNIARVPDNEVAQELLRSRYEAYCAQQAAALPAVLPRDGVRALYRSARRQVTGEVVDPLALLVEECRRVLPLPPFDLWAQDYLRNRRYHLEEMEIGVGPRKGSPVTIDVRRLQHGGRSWVAELAVFHEPPLWRGLITFHLEGIEGGAQHIVRHSTGDVFREDHSEDVRERFRSFSEDTLQAFLRSAIS